MPKQQTVPINILEKEIQETNGKLQMLNMVVNRYQTEIQEMNVNIKTVTDLTVKLYQVKGKYVEMEKRCSQFSKLRKNVTEKEALLKEKREEEEQGQSNTKSIASVETLIKIFTNNPQKTFPQQNAQLYSTYYRQLQQLFKFDK